MASESAGIRSVDFFRDESLFFEGTVQGVAGKITNVTRLRGLCVEDVRQKLHLEAGPGTHFGSTGLPSEFYSRDYVHSGELGKQLIGRIAIGYFTIAAPLGAKESEQFDADQTAGVRRVRAS